MKTYEQALFDVHKSLIDDIEYKASYKDSGYIAGMLDAARIVLNIMKNETFKKEDQQND